MTNQERKIQQLTRAINKLKRDPRVIPELLEELRAELRALLLLLQ